MNKKILIASIFAFLMLLVPINSVVGVSDVENDCGCQVVNSSDLFRVKLLMVRLKVVTNIVLLRFGHIPEVQEKCQEILILLNSDVQDYPIICEILESTFLSLSGIYGFLAELFNSLPEDSIFRILIVPWMTMLETITYPIYILLIKYNCWEILKS